MAKGWIPAKQRGDVPRRRTRRLWNSGPPPHAGWWNASAYQYTWSWRWWDGVRWSHVASHIFTGERAGRVAAKPEQAQLQACILWTDYWPPGARVERIGVLGTVQQQQESGDG